MKTQAFLFLGVFICSFFSLFVFTSVTNATTDTLKTDWYHENTVYFFHSSTCPHCRKEQIFLDAMQAKYPTLSIERYEVSEQESVVRMKELAEKHNIQDQLGGVPLTFIGNAHFLGFDAPEKMGVAIEQAIQTTLLGTAEKQGEQKKYFDLPFLGRVYADTFSLPLLAITLGFLDGFNVCSLGALMLIIGMTLKLQQRRSIILLGGTFVLTTAFVYGGLIVLWYKVFEYLSLYINYVKIGITFLALGGGVYFLKEYMRMRKEGAVCQLQESRLIARLMEKTGRSFKDNTKILALVGVVLLFATVVAVVEFPCSAATPLIFAGILADTGLSTIAYISHIALFVLFYMIDEIFIFTIAAYRLKLWMTNGAFTKYAVLAEAVILFAIGGVYLHTVLSF